MLFFFLSFRALFFFVSIKSSYLIRYNFELYRMGNSLSGILFNFLVSSLRTIFTLQLFLQRRIQMWVCVSVLMHILYISKFFCSYLHNGISPALSSSPSSHKWFSGKRIKLSQTSQDEMMPFDKCNMQWSYFPLEHE